MLRLVGLIVQTLVIALVVYNSVTALWGWRDRVPAPMGSRTRRLRVVIPAHNEEKVISGIVSDLKGSEYPASLVRICVLDDRSTDATARVATGAGAEVETRRDGPSGKGQALSWYLNRDPLEAGEVLVIFDADNRVGPEVLGRICDEIDSGQTVVQCYLDATNPDASWVAEASALSYWAGNRMVQLARSNLGWSADLGGTGMGFTPDALQAAGGFADSLTEDQDLGVRLLLNGHRVEWLHDVRVRDEKPRRMGAAVRQRARWMSGKRDTRRRHLGSLLRRRSPAMLDMAIRLIQPGRSFVALVSAVFTVLALTSDWSWLLPWPVWAVLTAIQFLLPVPFLAREGIAPSRLVRYPLLAILAILWIPIRLVSARRSNWYHTEHEGLSEDDAPARDL